MSNTVILKRTCYHFDRFPMPGQKRFHTLSEIKELLNTLHDAPDGDRVLKHIYVGFSYNIGVGKERLIYELASLLISQKLFVASGPVIKEWGSGGFVSKSDENVNPYVNPHLADGSRPLDDYNPSDGYFAPPQKMFKYNNFPTHFLELQYDFTNGEPVTDLPVTVTFQNKTVKEGVLNATGFKRFDHVPPGEAIIEYGDPDYQKEIVKLRSELKTMLDNMVEEVAENSRSLDAELQKEGLIGKGMVYTGAFLSGLYTGGKEIVTGVIQTMSAIQSAKDQILATAIETVMAGNLDKIREEIDNLEAKGTHLYEDLQEAYDTLSILSEDPDSKDLILSFPKRYFNELHPTNMVEMSGGLCTDILIGILTGGAGAAIGKSKYFTNARGVIQTLKKILWRNKYTKKLTEKVDQRVIASTEKFETQKIVRKKPELEESASKKAIREQDKPIDSKKAEPVDCVTGAVIVNQSDFTLPGRIPLDWSRSYASDKDWQGTLGIGWQTPADGRLKIDKSGVVTFFDGVSGGKVFKKLPMDQSILEEINGSLLSKTRLAYTVTLKSGLTYHFPDTFNEAGVSFLSEITDPSGNRVTFSRLGDTLESITTSSGQKIHVYSESGRIRKMFLSDKDSDEPQRLLVEYGYSEQRDLIAVYDALQIPYLFEYENHFLTRHTDREGLSFYYEYDNKTQKCIHTYGDKGLYDYTFDYQDGKTVITNSLGYKETYHYNKEFLTTKVFDHQGNLTCYEYDNKGRLFAVIDPFNQRTEYLHDRFGNLICLIRPDQTVVSIEYNDLHKPIAIKDPLGRISLQKWDEKGQLTQSITPSGAVTRYTYTKKGDIESTSAPNGATTQFETDRDGNIAAVIDTNGQKMAMNADEMGNITSITDAIGHVTRYEYDAKNRLTAIHKANEKTVRCQYDAADRLISFEDEAGNTTSFEYTAVDKVALRKNPDGTTLSYEYDTEEQLIGLINERGDRYAIQRDYAGRIIKETDYWGSSRNYGYNLVGQLCSSTNPLDETIYYRYNALGQLTEKLLPENRSEHYSYDLSGNLISHENEHIKVTRIFDDEDRLIQETQGNQSITFRYDINGNRIERISPHGNRINYAYDANNTLTGITINDDKTISIERDQNGFPIKEVLSGELTRTYVYDDEGKLTDQSILINNAPEITRKYEYDVLGNLTKRMDSNKGTDHFFYNPLGRITRHIDPEERIREFVHDPCGNLLQEGKKPLIGYRKAAFESETDIFDKAGRLKYRTRSNGKKQTLTFDAQDRLVHTRTERSDLVHIRMTITYDALGRRLSKQSFLKDTEFLWDGDTILSDDTESKGVREFVFYPGTFEPLAVIDENKEVLYYHNDHIGIPQEVTNKSGRIVWSAHYNTQGKIDQLLKNDFDNPIRMQGQYADDDIELYYNRHRYYNPHIGVFISQDPLGLFPGPNLYEYGVNVWTWIDPLGLTCKDASGKGTATIRQFENGYPEGHFTVEVDDGIKKLHTEQIITNADYSTTTIKRVPPSGPSVKTKVIEITDASSAINYQKSLIGKELGPYDVHTNSCLSHAVDVIEKGGGKAVSKSRLGLAKFLRKHGFGLLK